MKLRFRVLCVIVSVATVILFAGTRVLRAQDSDADSGSVMQQDSGAAQTQDAGAGVPVDGANSSGSRSQNILGGGMIGPDYTLGPEDVLTITVFNLPEMTETVRIENDGTITVKLLGPIKAAGLTVAELRDELQQDWGKTYLQDPHVTVFIRQFHSSPVSVVGAVAKPGLYQLPGPRTLIQVLAMAGGVNMPGTAAGSLQGGAPAGRWAYIARKKGFGGLTPVAGITELAPDQIKVDLGRLLYSHDTALNIDIKPFDTVTVSKAGIVYVVGNVMKSGGFTLEDRDNLTALEALSLAEGFKPGSNTKHDEIIHTLPDGTRQIITVDLGKIMKGKAKDPVLTANDILVVPPSALKSLGGSGIATALSTVSGLVIWRGL